MSNENFEDQDLDQDLDNEDLDADLNSDQDPQNPDNQQIDWEAKAKQAEADAKKYKSIALRRGEKLKTIGNSNKPAEKPAGTSDKDWRERMELKVMGHQDDEIDFLMRNGGKKALDDPFVKQTISNMQTQRKAEIAAVDTDANKSDIEQKYTADQLKGMSTTELEKILPKA